MKNKIYLKPLISEKTIDLAAKNCYTFLVDRRLSKPEIRQTVVAVFGIKPRKINLIRGQVKAVGKLRQKGKTSLYQKALVFIEKGKKLPGFEIAADKNKKSNPKDQDNVKK